MNPCPSRGSVERRRGGRRGRAALSRGSREGGIVGGGADTTRVAVEFAAGEPVQGAVSHWSGPSAPWAGLVEQQEAKLGEAAGLVEELLAVARRTAELAEVRYCPFAV